MSEVDTKRLAHLLESKYDYITENNPTLNGVDFEITNHWDGLLFKIVVYTGCYKFVSQAYFFNYEDSEWFVTHKIDMMMCSIKINY